MIKERTTSDLARPAPPSSPSSASIRLPKAGEVASAARPANTRPKEAVDAPGSTRAAAAKLIASGTGSALAGAFVQGPSRRIDSALRDLRQALHKEKSMEERQLDNRRNLVEGKNEV